MKMLNKYIFFFADKEYDPNSLIRINLPLFSTVVPAITFVLLSCRPFVAITTLSTGLVRVEVTC